MVPASAPAPEPAGPQGAAGPVPLVLAGRRPARGRERPPRHLADLPLAERRAVVAGLGQPPFRASQLSRHFFGRYTDQTDEMSDLPRAARGPLAQALLPRLLTAERELSCDGGTTRKTLWRAFDGALVESVLMRYPDRVTMCVSSQAGCGMACPFCATGQAGLTRNLSTAEIVAQVVAGARLLAAGQVPGGPGRISAGSGGDAPKPPRISAGSGGDDPPSPPASLLVPGGTTPQAPPHLCWFRGGRPPQARPHLEHRVHGHGGAAGQLRCRAGGGAPADRTGA